MLRKRMTVAAAGLSAAAVLLAAGCGSSSSGGSSGGTTTAATAKKTITVGVIADITGAAAPPNKSVVDGVKAGTFYAARNGYTIKYIVGDTATNPATALAVAQKLVTQDHVFAVLANSALMFAAAPYLTAHNVPVIGASQDGPEWIPSKNMFSIWGPLQATKVSTTQGKFFKMVGVTNLGVLANSVPTASEAGEGSAASAEVAGIKVGYLNAKFPLGGDVGPAVLAMKDAGVDGFVAAAGSDTTFAVIKGLQDQGVKLKAALLPTGYGGDLLSAGPGAAQAAQGAYFVSAYELVEQQTPATKQFVADVRQAGIKGEPTYASYNGYVSIGLLVRALKAAGANPTQASLITALEGIHDWNALGLYGSHTVDINDRENIVFGPDSCQWIAQFQGKTFKPVPNASPICGDVVPGRTVAPAS
ncbi:ABC transporter substrate-binding protein [Frankia sp. AgB1.9]|uniref:ABC transporter substrate-binding protein n=1 Tax=unclassified Frankia TaxID=2632575 RepID=UPI001932A380|nr:MULTISPECIES: ABC transporter substrate-binding protein [unclassified Frankia]MBL7486812.1 ABC transporter substrate-binding protein [Frankia sp. AgW1.1]MBL7554110.1 ABC transporter substrate-binding protein [Frankia sp. AgB1.9]MBL7618244.1 ABC transporter substrate-binding protein [Frankia sp. AgB1.8]